MGSVEIVQKVGNTLLNNLGQLLQSQKDFFDSGATFSLQSRLGALKLLEKVIKGNEKPIEKALKDDLGKGAFEVFFTELGFTLAELAKLRKLLPGFVKPTQVGSPLVFFRSSSRIIQQPKGCVLVLSPWNYPLNLSFVPSAGALAAGNTVILKPSEHAPATSALIHQIVFNAFAPEHFSVINGASDTAMALTQQPFDHIFFTGSTSVGKKVYQAAAENLVPVTLELGGKCPVYFHSDTNIDISARRLVWAKGINSGQTCLAPDRVLIHEQIYDSCIAAIKNEFERQFGKQAERSAQWGSIVSAHHHKRIASLMKECKVLYGGAINEKDRKIAPAIVALEEGANSRLLTEEIFGPLLWVQKVKDENEAIRIIRSNPTPLCVYVFTKSKSIEHQFIAQTRSGSVGINDLILPVANAALPFGGLGASGMGAYHGIHSLKTFSHARPVMKHAFFPDLKLRYAPHKPVPWWLKKMFSGLVNSAH